MKSSFKRILIAADLSEMDNTLFSFTENLVDKMEVQKIYLLHIIPNFTKLENAELDFHQKFTTGYPIDEKVKEVLREKMSTYFRDKNIEIEINVIEGQPYQQLLHWIEVKEVDLAVVGYKTESEGSGITAKRLARKTKASVLFVAEKSTSDIKTVLVPVDFSDDSAKALKTAIEFKNEMNHDVIIKAIHIVETMPMDHYYGLSLNYQYMDALVQNSKEAFVKFLKKYNIDQNEIEQEVLANEYNNVSQHIYAYVRNHDIQLVILGAQGHSTFERFLYGSVTEQLVNNRIGKSILVMR